MKHILSILVVLIYTISLFAYDCEIDGIYYNLNSTDLTAEVTSSSTYYFGSIIIPSTLTYNSKTYSVTTIGNAAFYNCTSLTSVIIPNSVTTIGEGTFKECRGLTSITIPNSVTMIGIQAFYNCSNLTSVTIPNSVTMIGSQAFENCRGLTKTNFTGTIDDWCKIKFANYFANPIRFSHNFFINDEEVKDLVIPEGVTSIGEYVFYGCFRLKSITFPNSVTTIGELAFYGCSGLTSVTIPNSITTIRKGTFWDCSGLTSIIIPNSVKTIGNQAFENCRGLTLVTIPKSVTTIGQRAFSGCTGLTSVIIGNSVTTIGDDAFYGCSNLTSITIPNSVTTIGEYALAWCNSLISITCYTNTPPKCGGFVFHGINQYAEVYVPVSALTDYQNAEGWKEMQLFPIAANITPIDGDNPIVTPSDQDVTITWPITDGTDTYTLTITKNGETVCVLTFNTNGQLTNIAFAAPGHNGARQAPAATLTAQGYQFTVTGLNPGTAYNYSVTATDAGGKTLAEHKGNFSTTGGTGFESVHDAQPTMHKVLRNGQLLIEANNATYTPMGQKVK